MVVGRGCGRGAEGNWGLEGAWKMGRGKGKWGKGREEREEDQNKKKKKIYTAGITANNVMPRAVNPPRVDIPLQLRHAQIPVVEAVDVGVVHDGAVRVVGAGSRGRVLVDVAPQAPRVAAEPVRLRVGGDVAHDGGLGAEGHDHAVLRVVC